MNILFIDDHDAFRQVTSEVLEHLGYEVVAVNSLVSALKALRNAQFDLILSDLCISGDKDGFLILDFLDSMDIDLPVIFITGSYGKSLIPTHKWKRSVGFLQKPVRMSELKRAIESSVHSNRVSGEHLADGREVSSSGLLSCNATANTHT